MQNIMIKQVRVSEKASNTIPTFDPFFYFIFLIQCILLIDIQTSATHLNLGIGHGFFSLIFPNPNVGTECYVTQLLDWVLVYAHFPIYSLTQNNYTAFLLQEIKQTESLKSIIMKHYFQFPIFFWLFSESHTTFIHITRWKILQNTHTTAKWEAASTAAQHQFPD